MKATELRSGNLVIGQIDEFETKQMIVTALCFSEPRIFLNCRWCLIEDLVSPIPLTEEWIVKLGLKDEFYIKESLVELYEHFAVKGIWFFNIEKALCIEINYVHQLQNLYFALTGKELKLNK